MITNRPGWNELWRVCLLLVAGVAVACRLWGIGEKSLWTDEASALWVARQGPAFAIDWCRDPLANESPARALIMCAGLSLAPNPVFGIRLPSLLAGLVLIPLAWGLGDRVGGRPTGLIAAALVMLSPLLIEHSQDARYYSVVLALEAAGLLALFAARESPRNLWLWAAAGGASGLAFLCSYTAAPVTMAVGISLAAALVFPGAQEGAVRHAWRVGALVGLGALVAILALWMRPIVDVGLRSLGVIDVPMLPGVNQPPESLATWHFPAWTSNLAGELIHPVRPMAALVAIAAAAGLCLATARQPRAMFVVILALALSVIIPAATCIRHTLYTRYVIHVHLLVLILAAAACGALWRSARKGPVGFGAPLAALFVAAVVAAWAPAVWRATTFERQSWRAAVDLIAQDWQRGQCIVTGAFWSEQPVQFYASGTPMARAIRPSLFEESAFREAMRDDQMVWYVGWGELPDFVREVLRERFHLQALLPGTRGDVYVYRRRGGPRELASM